MQSGITASDELHDAFNSYTADPSLFALPITIASEALHPQPAIPFASSSSTFEASLPSLADHLHPKTPIYLLLRRSPTQNTGLVALTYVPATAPVRAKMLFASTRSTLVRDLGLEKFGETVFVTDASEVLDPQAWAARSAGADAGSAAGRDEGILSREERELQGVKRAEEEERHGTQGRDLMGAGGSGGGRLAMKITDEARAALAKLAAGGDDDGAGVAVQLGIELASETLTLLRCDERAVEPAAFLQAIPRDSPSYSFLRHRAKSEGEPHVVVFVYTCPTGSKVKERMVYASARASVLQAAKGQGVDVTRRLEQGDAGEVTEDRLREEMGLKGDEEGAAAAAASSGAPRQGFARPKRPGRR